MYQQDEKQIWLNMNVAKDPQYMRKREAYLIYQNWISSIHHTHLGAQHP